jgi:uncharacterized membrane protein YccC
MGLWLILLLCALVAFLVGASTAANWLFIIAVVLLVAGLFTGYGSRRRTRV